MRAERAVAALVMFLAVSISGCDTPSVSDKTDPLKGDIIDEANLTQLMLQAGDPDEAVRYFENAVAREPDRADFRRGLAQSYARAKRYPEAARVYQELLALRQEELVDRLDYAYVAVRLDRWDDATALAASLPAALDTPRRHLLDAMLADHGKDWEAADRAYARAEALSTSPADVLNNWGVSKMARGDLPEASRTFERAVSYDSRLFSAKNNLAISRALQGDFRLPIVPMTDTERATIQYNMGVIAQQKGELRIARGLYAAALQSHPMHYQAAADRLAQLDSAIVN